MALYHGVGENSWKRANIVSMTFFWGDRGTRDVPRVPFRNSHGWLFARLSILLEDQDHILQSSDDDGAVEDADMAKALIQRLTGTLPSIFPLHETELSIIFHDDLHAGNILINEAEDLAAILDWECVSALPIWMACQPPALLKGRTREDEPRRKLYSPYDPKIDHGNAEENQGVAYLYWEHLLEYERGQLHTFFMAKMERLQSG